MASDPSINQFNEQWRSSPLYAQGLASVGANPNGPLRLSDGQRKQLQAFIEQNMGIQFPKGVEVDPAGNMNEDEGFGKQLAKWGPIAGAGALAAFGIPGLMPGLIGGASAGAPALGNVNGITAALGGGGGGMGGILSTIGKFAGPLSSIGSVLGGAVKGKEDARAQDARALLQNQQLLQQGARDQFSAGLQGAQFQREGQDRERKQQILMQLLNNTQDANIQPGNPAIAARMGVSTGGARPSNLTTNRESLLALLGQPQVSAPQYQAPPSMKVPMASGFEKALDFGALGTSILGALGGRR